MAESVDLEKTKQDHGTEELSVVETTSNGSNTRESSRPTNMVNFQY